ncbi:hypothetical protein BT67DRAFT_312904 [Trichocladium antarcticum]|uniref:Uncharacterized protein n=1 Tax=Trichocladium antarcticum TaxID=1450529 RepID=A0AAN6UJW6_9PEZI|nr:hypothetical protein BT67DRAFT_312904 [Trichocladium antarcticum]
MCICTRAIMGTPWPERARRIPIHAAQARSTCPLLSDMSWKLLVLAVIYLFLRHLLFARHPSIPWTIDLHARIAHPIKACYTVPHSGGILLRGTFGCCHHQHVDVHPLAHGARACWVERGGDRIQTVQGWVSCLLLRA